MDKTLLGGTVVTGCISVAQGRSTNEMLLYLLVALVVLIIVLMLLLFWHVGHAAWKCRMKKKRLKQLLERKAVHVQPC